MTLSKHFSVSNSDTYYKSEREIDAARKQVYETSTPRTLPEIRSRLEAKSFETAFIAKAKKPTKLARTFLEKSELPLEASIGKLQDFIGASGVQLFGSDTMGNSLGKRAEFVNGDIYNIYKGIEDATSIALEIAKKQIEAAHLDVLKMTPSSILALSAVQSGGLARFLSSKDPKTGTAYPEVKLYDGVLAYRVR